MNETKDLETIDVTNNSHNDSESEQELEEEEEDGVDEEEVQNMLDIRIIEDELNYGNLGNESRNHFNKARDNDSFCLNAPKKQTYQFEKQIKHELSSNNAMSYEEMMRINHINQLSNSNRWRLYRFWRKLYFQKKEIQIKSLNKKYAEKLKEFERIRLEEDLYILREADIVGLTTTGAAKFRSIIEQIDPLIVVVEETAEVLESHVVTSLMKSTKHLILIGDHQQLKPNPNVYDLAINYNLIQNLMSETLLLITENQFYDEGKQLIIEAFDLLSTLMPFNQYIELKFRLLVNYAQKYKHLKQLELISEPMPHYLLIKEYFDNSRAHVGVNISLKSIHRYNNLEFKKSFENNFSKDSRVLLWHGIKQTFLDSIFAEGLKLPKHGRMFGKGIYFADRVTKSVNYTDYKRGVGTLLLCEVAVGDT